MALGEKRNGTIFAADAERRDAPEYRSRKSSLSWWMTRRTAH